MIQKFTLILFFLFSFNYLFSQTAEELNQQKAAKEAELATLQGQVSALKSEVNAINAKLDGLNPWKFGALGTIGVNFSQFNNWFGSGNDFTYSSVIGFSGNAFANLNKDKYFWRNAGNLNIVQTKLVTEREQRNTTEYQTTADAVNATSLFGYKVSPKFAISTLGEYRSTISSFNDPGFLDLGVGATWTPITDLVVVFHPLNYNFVFSQDELTYESSLGCKIVADYARSLPNGINWRSNVSAFVSYDTPADYSNWTWVNAFSMNIWKGLGVGFEVGLRGNKQEAYNYFVTSDDDSVFGNLRTFENTKISDLEREDNPVQTYWILGLSYSL